MTGLTGSFAKVSIAIERRGRERAIATFPYFNSDAQELMDILQCRQIAAICYQVETCNTVAWTTSYKRAIV